MKKGYKLCSHCGKEIKEAGGKCQFCGKYLDKNKGDEFEDLYYTCKCGALIHKGDQECFCCGTKFGWIKNGNLEKDEDREGKSYKYTILVMAFLGVLLLLSLLIYYLGDYRPRHTAISVENGWVGIITKSKMIGNYYLNMEYIGKQFKGNTRKSYDKCKEWAEENKELDTFGNVRCGLGCKKIPTVTGSGFYVDSYLCEDEVSVKENNIGCHIDLEMGYTDSKFCQTFDNFDYCKKYECD